MSGNTGIVRALNVFLSVTLLAGLTACGPFYEEPGSAEPMLQKAAAQGKGAFNGVWKVSFKPIKDQCGIAGKKAVKSTIAIQQKGKKAVIIVAGMPKYKGTVSGNRLTGSGKYTLKNSGSKIVFSGNLAAVLLGKKLNVTSAKLTLKQGKNSCDITFSGMGTKAK